MVWNINNMQYPLKERIGEPELLTGREKEFDEFQKWISGIPKELSKSRAILARKKSGKTAFMQRLFNQIWSLNGEGWKAPVIPFYMEIPETRICLPDFAELYYCTFASHYISFLERKPELVRELLTSEEIQEYGEKNSIPSFVRDIKELKKHFSRGTYNLMWQTAVWAPHRFAGVYGKPVLVMIDEFQNLNGFIYRDEKYSICEESLPGSYHELSESKIAPMLVSGSQVGWLLKVISQYLQMGRLKKMKLSPYLLPDDGVEAVCRYARFYGEVDGKPPINNEMAVILNRLCFSDPFFISCMIGSSKPDRDLTTVEGILATRDYEVGSRDAELAQEWVTYLDIALDRINEKHAKNMLLLLTKEYQRTWTPQEVKEELKLDLDEKEVHKKLEMLVKADLIYATPADYEYQGQQDGTFFLILQARFKNELKSFSPPDLHKGGSEQIAEIKKENSSLKKVLNNHSGKIAELQLGMDIQTRKHFFLKTYFENLPIEQDQKEFQYRVVKLRQYLIFPHGGKKELDLWVDATDERTLLVEVKKWKTSVGMKEVKDFWEKVKIFKQQNPDRKEIAGFLSLGGFRQEALHFCQTHGIGTATEINYIQTEWS